MSGKAKKQVNASSSSSSSSSSASSVVSTGPVDWEGNPKYYAHLLELRSKDAPNSWKDDLDAMKAKFPGVNFTIDGIQAHHKKQVANKKIAEKAVSEVLSSSSAVVNEDDDDSDSGDEGDGAFHVIAKPSQKNKAAVDPKPSGSQFTIVMAMQEEIDMLNEQILKLTTQRDMKIATVKMLQLTINKK